MYPLRSKAYIWFSFFFLSEEAILRDTDRVEEGIRGRDPPKIVANASNIARRAYRVLQVAEQEAENSEDPAYVDKVKDSANVLRDSKSNHFINAISVY